MSGNALRRTGMDPPDPGDPGRRKLALVLTAAGEADHAGLTKVLEAAGYAVSRSDNATPNLAEGEPRASLVIVDLMAAIPNTTRLLNLLSHRDPIPQIVFWGTGPTDVGVVEFDQTVRLNWLSRAWHLDTLHQLEQRLRTRGRPNLVVKRCDLEGALEAGQIELHYQPTLDLRNPNAPTPVEGLLRWRHPALGLLSASDFLPDIDDSAMRRQLTEFALTSALGQLSIWPALGIHNAVSVNLDAGLLSDVQFPKRLARLAKEHGVDPAGLYLEVSEHGVMSGSSDLDSIVEALVERDFRLILDNFGEGQISVQRVLLLPFHKLKISAYLVQRLGSSDRARRLARGIIHLAHDMDMRACGKGVENAEQLLLLKNIGCDSAQGWYIGGPESAAALVEAAAGVRPRPPGLPGLR